MRRYIAGFVLGMLIVPSSLAANAVIGTEVLPVGPYSEGTTITLRIRTLSNTTTAPTVFAFRINFDGEAVRFVNAGSAWAGSVISGPVLPAGSAPAKYVDIVGFSFGNANPTPTFANVRFVVGNSISISPSVSPFTITVGDNPNTDLTLADNFDNIIPHTFDNAGSTNLVNSDGGDTDGDGLTTLEEAGLGTNPLNADTDGDLVEDGVEVIIGTNPLVADSHVDADGDGLPDAFDPDSNSKDTDGDGILDSYEVSQGTDPTDPDSKPVLGDVTGDNILAQADVLLMARVYLGLQPFTALIQPKAADVNRDGILDNIDFMLLANLLQGKVDAIPLPPKKS